MLLLVDAVDVKVANRLVVRSASIHVDKGEVVFIVGPNASGKTSLLSAIAGLPRYQVVNGRIFLRGHDITGLPAWERARQGIALAHQLPPPMKYLRGTTLVRELSKIHHVDPELVRELAARLRVEKLLERRLFRGMSGGERKRLELFLTLLQNPAVLLLDEPDSGVDVDTVTIIAEMVVEKAAEGRGIVAVSHSPLLARLVISRGISNSKAYIMCGGEIVAMDEAYRVYSRIESEGFSWIPKCRG